MATRKQPIKTIGELIKFLGQTYPLDGEIDVETLDDSGDGPLTFTASLCEPKEEPSTTSGHNDNDFINIIADPASWPNFMRLFNNASVIIGEFDQHGETLQSNSDGMYDETTSIEKLRGAIYLVSPGFIETGDYLPHLTDEQQKRLIEVAVEVQAAGNGDSELDEEDKKHHARCDVETMTPLERLNCLPDNHEWRVKRLGFDPFPGE